MRLDRYATRTPSVRERARAIANEQRFLPGLRDVHSDGKPLLSGERDDGLIELRAHGIRRMGRDSGDKLRAGESTKLRHSLGEFRHAGVALSGVGAEHFLIEDPARAEIVRCAHDRAGRAGVGDAGYTRSPAFPKAGGSGLKKLRVWRLLF